MSSCEECPFNTYAAQLRGQRDFYACPAADSPAIRFSPNYVWKSIVNTNPLPSRCTQLTVGAHQCTPCPADTPYTWSTASTSVAACKKCPEGMFFDAVKRVCGPCRQRCNYPEEYETQECTEYQNRACAVCDMKNCDPVLEKVETEKGCDFLGNPCVRCTNKPLENSHYTLGALGPNTCAWACDEGYFSRFVLHLWIHVQTCVETFAYACLIICSWSRIGESVCEKCTEFNATSCPAGFVFIECSSWLYRDAACDTECNAMEHGKPVENSEWVLTTIDEKWNIVKNEGHGSGPNVACMWDCVKGYKKQILNAGYDETGVNLVICVPDVELE